MPILPFVDFTPSGASGSQYNVQTFTLSGTDISNKFVTLSGTPTDVAKTTLIVIGGDLQEYAVDFIITGTHLSWSSLGLEALLIAGDRILVQYN